MNKTSVPPVAKTIEIDLPLEGPSTAGKPTRLYKPIFISGLRKSGTSMTKDLLDGHPDLYVFPPNELHFFRFTDHDSIVKDKLARESDLEKLKMLVATQKFVDQLEKRSRMTTLIDFETYHRIVRDARVASHAEIYQTILFAMAKASPWFQGDVLATRFVSKSVLETEYVPDLVRWFPDMKFIYVLRNPYGHFNAIRWSMRSQGEVDTRTKKFSAWRHPYPYLGPELKRMKLSYYFMRRWKRLYPEHFDVLVYDRLVLNPEEELRKLCAFLELEFHECLLGTTKCGESRARGGWTTDQNRTDNSIDPSPATRWREQISPLEIRLVNRYFAREIEEFGFEVIPSRASRLLPFHISERPTTYVLNRMLFASRVAAVWD